MVDTNLKTSLPRFWFIGEFERPQSRFTRFQVLVEIGGVRMRALYQCIILQSKTTSRRFSSTFITETRHEARSLRGRNLKGAAGQWFFRLYNQLHWSLSRESLSVGLACCSKLRFSVLIYAVHHGFPTISGRMNECKPCRAQYRNREQPFLTDQAMLERVDE